jgi:tetrahydromethanopterin S-methyltransferase subunit B
MEARIQKLEEFAIDARDRLARIETRLDQMATKADVHEMSATLIKWIVGMISGASIAAIAIMTLVLNNAVPKVGAPPAPAVPIIIQIPAPAPAAPVVPAR